MRRITVCCLVVFFVWLSGISTSLSADKVNILLVMADDMGWSDLGSYGSEIDTPNLDSLADKDKQRESRAMEVYAGMINNMDYHFGRVVRFLKDIGEYDNTIIIFLSDNGPNPWYSEDYPGNAGSEWFSQFDNSTDNIGHPMPHREGTVCV